MAKRDGASWRMTGRALVLVAALAGIGGAGRTARAATQAIDLPAQSPARSMQLDGATFEPSSIRAGLITVGGIEFKVDPARLVRVDHKTTKPVDLAKIAGKASTLYFLHTAEPGRAMHDYRMQVAMAHRQLELPPAPPTVMSYVVRYDDGVEITVPVRFGESIEDWYRVQTIGPMLWTIGHHAIPLRPGSSETDAHAVLYAMTWPNPRPDVAIATVSVLGTTAPSDLASTIVAGVTIDRSEPAGRLIFVDQVPLGSDKQPGTYDAPFATIEQAVTVAKPGDTIFVRGRTFAIDRPIVVTSAGAENRWLTISAMPGETPVIDGSAVIKDPRKQPFNADAPRVPFDWDLGLIQLSGQTDYVRVQGFRVQNSPQAGISAYGPEREQRSKFVDIRFNETCRTFSMGIITHGVDDLTIIGNRVARPHSQQSVQNPFTLAPETSQALPQEAIDLSRNTRFEVAFNEVYGGGKEAIDGISVTDGRIHHNYVHTSLNGIYIDSWTIPIERIEIDRNFIHDAFAGIPLATEGSSALKDFRIHHNIVVASKCDGIAVTEATYKATPTTVEDIVVAHNTVHDSGRHGAGINWMSSGIRVSGFQENPNFRRVNVLNNIVTDSVMMPLSTGFKDIASREISFSHNVLFPNEDRMTAVHRSNESSRSYILIPGESTVAKDPLYVDPSRGDFRLRDGSPAIGAAKPSELSKSSDAGALPHGSAWRAGFDFAGRVTAYYRGDVKWEPIEVPGRFFTIHRNSLQQPSWFQIGRYGADFQRLPDGPQSMSGVDWYIRPETNSVAPTVMVLRGIGSQSDRSEIGPIPVARKAQRLAFLHTFHPNDRAPERGGQLFHYRVEYADGSTAEVPVLWNKSVGHWFADGLDHLPEARLAWSMPVQQRRNRVTQLRLFSMEWQNPKADSEIRSITIVADAPLEAGAAAVFAISAGQDD